MNILEIKQLSIFTPLQVKVLSNLSLSLAPGDRLGMIGESGSGKSLTALAIMGLLPLQLRATGSLLLGVENKTEVIGATERSLNSIRGKVASIVFQEPLTALDPLMKIGRQLAEPIRRHQGLSGIDLNRAVIEALVEVKINNPVRIAHSFPYQISGGERQRTAIAMALACQPHLLIADEPTTALDVTVQAEILALLDSILINRKMALLFISHDLAVVNQITEKVVILKGGSIVESGSLAEIIASPFDLYTKKLVESARRLDRALTIGGNGE